MNGKGEKSLPSTFLHLQSLSLLLLPLWPLLGLLTNLDQLLKTLPPSATFVPLLLLELQRFQESEVLQLQQALRVGLATSLDV